MLFLIEYDVSASKTVSLATYSDTDFERANDERLAMELGLRHRGVRHEVVILQAPSEAALRETHARYFEGLGAMYSRLESNRASLVRETKD